MFDFSILEYMGKYTEEDVIYGIFVLLSAKYNNHFSEAICFYNDQGLTITIEEELEKIIGSKLEDRSDYQNILNDLYKKLVPFNELVNRIDVVDFSKYRKLKDDDLYQGESEEVNPNDIKQKEE